MRPLAVAVTLLLLIVAGSAEAEEAVCATSAVFMCDNWETHVVGNNLHENNAPCGPQPAASGKTPFWSVSSEAGNPPYQNCGVHAVTQNAVSMPFAPVDGTKALLFAYSANAGTDQLGSAGYWSTVVPIFRTFYVRWYVRFSSNFVFPGNNSTKQLQIKANDNNDVLFPGHIGIGTNPEPVIRILDNVAPGNLNDRTFFQNVNHVAIQRDVWTCFEYRFTVDSSPGVADGIIEGWINDVQTNSHTGVTMLHAGLGGTGFPEVFITGSGFGGNCGAPCTIPDQQRWMDRLVFSQQRIFCGAVVSVPPAAPTNLTVTVP